MSTRFDPFILNLVFVLLTVTCGWLQENCTQRETEVYCLNVGLNTENVGELFRELPNNSTLLSLENNHLNRYFSVKDSIGNRTFAHMKILYLNGNYLREIPKNLSMVFPNLEELYIEGNGIRHLTKDRFYGLSSLKVLSLQRNSIQRLFPSGFVYLSNLQHLKLQMNHLGTHSYLNNWYYYRSDPIEPSSFDGLSNLALLDLRYNDIRRLPAGVFSLLTHPERHIDLSSNEYQDITDEFYTESKTMKKLDLSDNYIQKIERDAFEGFKFTHPNVGLDLSFNSFREFPHAVLEVEQGNISFRLNRYMKYTLCTYGFYTKSKSVQLIFPKATKLSLLEDKQCPSCTTTLSMEGREQESGLSNTTIKKCKCINEYELGVCKDSNKNNTLNSCSCSQKVLLNKAYDKRSKSDTNATDTVLNIVGVIITLAIIMLVACFSYYANRRRRRRIRRRPSLQTTVVLTDDEISPDENQSETQTAIFPQADAETGLMIPRVIKN